MAIFFFFILQFIKKERGAGTSEALAETGSNRWIRSRPLASNSSFQKGSKGEKMPELWGSGAKKPGGQFQGVPMAAARSSWLCKAHFAEAARGQCSTELGRAGCKPAYSTWVGNGHVCISRREGEKEVFLWKCITASANSAWGHWRTEEFKGSPRLPFTLALDLTGKERRGEIYMAQAVFQITNCSSYLDFP